MKTIDRIELKKQK
jgi:hypothetical protein